MNIQRIVLDTNIVSYLMRGRLAPYYKHHLQGKRLAVAFITVGELYFGAEKARWGDSRRDSLERTLRSFVVIPYDNEIARCYGKLVAERERNGTPIAPNDAWIAACAVRHAVPLVTHNAKHFSGIHTLRVVSKS